MLMFNRESLSSQGLVAAQRGMVPTQTLCLLSAQQSHRVAGIVTHEDRRPALLISRQLSLSLDALPGYGFPVSHCDPALSEPSNIAKETGGDPQ